MAVVIVKWSPSTSTIKVQIPLGQQSFCKTLFEKNKISLAHWKKKNYLNANDATQWSRNLECYKLQQKGWEPWSSGFGRRLVYWRSWVRIPALYTGWTFSNVKIVMIAWKDQKTKKRPGMAYLNKKVTAKKVLNCSGARSAPSTGSSSTTATIQRTRSSPSRWSSSTTPSTRWPTNLTEIWPGKKWRYTDYQLLIDDGRE